MDPTSAAAQKLLAMVEEQAARLARDQALVTDGFALAFLDATGLRADECEMIVENNGKSDHLAGEHRVVQRIWFQRRTPAPGRR